MRTTIDLEPDVHQAAMAHARRSRRSLSQVVNEALRLRLQPVPPVERDTATGFGVISIGRPLTMAEVRDALEED